MDSMTSTQPVVGLTGAQVEVVATGLVAAWLPPVVRLAWSTAPSDTIPVPKLDSPKGIGRAVLGGLGNIVRRIFGRSMPAAPPAPEPPPLTPSQEVDQ